MEVFVILDNYVSPPSHFVITHYLSLKMPLGWFWPLRCLPTINCFLGSYDETLLSFANSLFLSLIYMTLMGFVSSFVQSLKSFLGEEKLKVMTFLY